MPRKRNGHPNVVVFFTDQQRWDSTGAHGNPLDLTPNFDRIAAGGTHVFNCCTCQPVCGPARASLQTGLYATATGSWRNGIALAAEHQQRTLARYFNDAGYHTGYVGKWHLGGSGEVGPVAKDLQGGYQYWMASEALEFTSEAYRTTMYDGDGNPHQFPGYRVDAVADEAIRYIDAHKDEPFFLFTSFIEPHFQNRIDDFPPPEGYRERYAGRWVPPDLAALGGTTHQHLGGYWGMCKRLDEAFGRMLDAIKSLDLAEDTVVLFTSDHGCHFKTRNGEYKRSCHESSVRIPTVLAGPGFEGGGQLRQPISLVDIPPTLLDAAGIDVPEHMHGRSILPLTRGETDGWPEEVFIQISESQVGRAVRTSRWKYSVVAPDANGATDASADRYVEEFLYDLEADPYELCNLINEQSHAPVADRLRERLIARMVEAGEAAPTIDPADRHPSGQRTVLDEEVRM